MDPTEYATLARRLIDNPQDGDALAAARRLGMRDAGTYALLLEKVAHGSHDRGVASHWFTEAAAVWETTLGDIGRAEAVLRDALRADPWNDRAADKLAQLLGATADREGLIATLEGRAAACASRANDVEDGAIRAAEIYSQLARRLSTGPLARADRALAAFQQAMSLNPRNRDVIRGARSLYAASSRWTDVAATFEMERALLRSSSDTIGSYRDEAAMLKAGGDLAGAVRALRFAYALDDNDLEVAEELANAILTRIKNGGNVSKIERVEASELFLSLAETYEGEMALSHVLNALRANSGSDIAIEHAFRLAGALGHEAMLAPFGVAYLAENPRGKHAVRVRFALAKGHESAGRLDDAIRVLAPIEGENEQAAAKVLSLVQRTGRVEDLVSRMDAQAAAAPPASRFRILLEAARALDRSGREDAAVARYEQVLALNPGHPEALDKVASRLRAQGLRPQLRDRLMKAAVHGSTQPGTRRALLREAAELSLEIGDREQAREILAQLYEANRNDDAVRDLLKRVLIDMERWDEVVGILDREIGAARSADKLVAVLREHASIHESGRNDLVAAAHSWARIAKLSPDDDAAVFKAVALFEKADRLDEAISLLSSAVQRVPETARALAFARMATLAEKRGTHREAADAAASRAALTGDAQDWRDAERLFALAGAWPEAVDALDHQRQPEGSAVEQAATHARRADYLAKAGEFERAMASLERACEFEPADAYIDELQKHAEASSSLRRFVSFALRRADELQDKEMRVSLRRRATRALRDGLLDHGAALEVQRKVLLDIDDTEALTDLAEDADRRSDHAQACDLLLRLEAASSEPADRLRILLRVARIRFDKLDDGPGAVELLERVLLEVDGDSTEALEESVRIRTAREDWAGVAMVLERAKARTNVAAEKLAFEQRLAELCEARLGDTALAIEHLRRARALDAANRDIVRKLARLHESRGEWNELAETLALLVEGETDSDQVVLLTIRRAEVLDENLGQVDGALDTLAVLADRGDPACRAAYVAVADRAGRKRVAAEKLQAWADGESGTHATESLAGAFDRYLECGLVREAGQVLAQLGAAGAVDTALSSRLEEAALAARDFEVAQIAQRQLIAARQGADRAAEVLRQAEALATAGAPKTQVVLAAEAELAALPGLEIGPLLPRLAELAGSPEERISLFERQIARSGEKAERIAAIAVAAAEAARQGLLPRCQRLLAMGVATSTQDDDFVQIEHQVVEADQEIGGVAVRRAWAEALAEGASNTRIANIRRTELLRRAGRIAYRDLHDPGQAFDWFNEAMFVRLEALVEAASEQQSGQLRGLAQSVAALDKRLDRLEARLSSLPQVSGTPSQPPVAIGAPARVSVRTPSPQPVRAIPIEVDAPSDDRPGRFDDLSELETTHEVTVQKGAPAADEEAEEVEVSFDGPLPSES